MFGIAVLFGLAIYAGACFLLVWLTVKKSVSRGWLWGLIVFVIYNAPLGYQIGPALVMKPYLCATEAGFWLYKTPEQWKAENPGVAETLKAFERTDTRVIKHKDAKYLGEYDETLIFHLNQRFNEATEYRYIAKNFVRKKGVILDTKANEIMAVKIDYRIQAFLLGRGLDDGCDKIDENRWLADGHRFSFYSEKFKKIGE